MTQIPFDPNASIEILPVTVTQTQILEVSAGFGSSLFQTYQDYLTLDGGRPNEVMTNIEPLDGGRP